MIDLSIDPDVRDRLGPAWRRRLRTELARMVAAASRQAGGAALDAAFRLCGDDVIHELNRTWRKKDKPTDVLAFALREGPGADAGYRMHGGALGDVVISLDTARRQQKQRGPAGLYAEVRFLAAHGLCHLLGYDHNDDAEEATMNARMASLLAEASKRGTIRPA